MHGTKAGRFSCHVKGCDAQFYHRVQLMGHLKTQHDLTIYTKKYTKLICGVYSNSRTCSLTVQQTKEFPNWEAFETWKEEGEAHAHLTYNAMARESNTAGKCFINKLTQCHNIIHTYPF